MIVNEAIYKSMASNAIQVQNACNLSGVVSSFSRVFVVLWEQARTIGQGTQWVNNHPICILFSTQIAFLSGTSPIGCDDQEKWARAMRYCEMIAEEGSCAYDVEPQDSLNKDNPPPVQWTEAEKAYESR